MPEWSVDLVIAAAVLLEFGWFITYLLGPWRATDIGWVWLMKGASLLVVFTLLLVNQFVQLGNVMWFVAGLWLDVSIALWWRVTVLAGRGRL